MRRILPLMWLTTLGSVSQAQAPAPMDFPPQQLSLANLSAFQSPTANWKLAGAVSADRTRPMGMTADKGTGILVNSPSPNAKGHLLTTWEHGDIDLSLDVMMPKGSNSGVYLMGRYEVQLFDSWGVREPTFADFGGIYQRWNDDAPKGHEGYEGNAPRVNASRAPGLWQHMDVVFRAPKFAAGKKIANAKFVKVTVNGVVIHENVEVTGPTQSAIFSDERATGPLMIQGDHGPVAIRNIKYKTYAGTVALSGLHYHVYQGEPMDASFMASHAAMREGNATTISSDLATPDDKLAVKYDGTLRVPSNGHYRFQLNLGWIGNDSATRGARVGGGTIAIDGIPVVAHMGTDRRSSGETDLTAGSHTFALTYYKNRPGFNRRDVSVWLEGPGVERQALSEDGGAPYGGGGQQQPIGAIMVEPQGEAMVLRGFMRHRDAKRVIVAAVADPLGVHYSYDLAQATPLHVWRGPFLETTQMWHERGESQTAEPLGSAVTLSGAPTFAFLADARASWPDSVASDRELRRDGYQLDKTGHPTFLYRVRDVSVEDIMRPDADGASLKRELRLHAPSSGANDHLYVLLAQDARISTERDGSYVIGDRSYYVAVPRSAGRPIVREVNGRSELLLPVRFDRGEANVTYTIVW